MPWESEKSRGSRFRMPGSCFGTFYVLSATHYKKSCCLCFSPHALFLSYLSYFPANRVWEPIRGHTVRRILSYFVVFVVFGIFRVVFSSYFRQSSLGADWRGKGAPLGIFVVFSGSALVKEIRHIRSIRRKKQSRGPQKMIFRHFDPKR